MDDAFDVFYRDTCRRLLRFAYGLTGDPIEAQDMVQEAYARAWQRWRRLRRYEDAEAWLRLVVTRLVTDRWRWLGVRHAAAAADRPPPPVAPPSEDTVLLVGALRALPMAHRRALVLHYLLDRPIADIAIETGASVGTVKSWLSRGRASLAAALGESTPAEPVVGGQDA
jgi:RNA polymerase sigma-70 factor, ECF subfamily